MKISLEIPEWAVERHIYIMAGSELLAFKKAFENELLVKDSRCNNCGKCCMNILKPDKFRFPVVDGNCAHLIIYRDGKTSCGLGMDLVPFSCCTGDPVLGKASNFEGCCITYKKEKLGNE